MGLCCDHLMCSECIQQQVISQCEVTCPTCSITHSLLKRLTCAPSPLLLAILSKQEVMCGACNQTIKPTHSDDYLKSECTKHVQKTVKSMLQSPLTRGLNPTEEEVMSHLVGRKLSASRSGLVPIRSGGPECCMFLHG